MSFGLCLALCLMPAVVDGQSGDVEMDAEPRLICTSHISQKAGNSLTCNLSAGKNANEDDEDDEDDDIRNMTVCFCDMTKSTTKCLEVSGKTITSSELSPITAAFNVTVQLKSGGKINRSFNLKTIVKPRSPQVWNATFHGTANKAVIHIRIPYQDDYLKANNQLFQVHIRSTTNTLIRNITSEALIIDGEYLQKNTDYHVKVRAIPKTNLQGSWSEWSTTLNFSTNIELHEEREKARVLLYYLTVSLVTFLLVIWSVVFFWRRKIYTYIWPNIPHPKHTLVQIYKPVKTLPVSFNPEVFSDLNIVPVEKIEEQHCSEAEQIAADDIAQLMDPCPANTLSGETLDSRRRNTGMNTEVSESTLLSGSPTSKDDPAAKVQDTFTLGIHQLAEEQLASLTEHTIINSDAKTCVTTKQNKDEAYVTMSSLYKIK
ncbi:interleukin-7 receptor subunit alpha [Lampris incognitus]|uniref:interleukin-7 receptor subunit alpha n=1 Tax=Lampris incognitus TaxID=2546036 RepID=UPI0024B4EEA9|nr:interleukin-7 receptor subunit alpha [Lampris incognitus]